MIQQNKANTFIFPQPTGSFAVGKQTFHLTDTSRPESYLPGSLQFRELMITAWYPAAQKNNELSSYAPGFLIDSLKEYLRLNKEIMNEDLAELESIGVHAAEGIPVSCQQASWPLIIFSHGYHGSRFYYATLCEELASHGYIVVAIDHTYDCGITQFPDGSIKSFMPLSTAPDDSDEFYDSFRTRLAIREADIQFIIKAITAKEKPLFAHVDTSNIGLFGHSLGAEAALLTAANNEYITAVAAMDAFPVGQTLSNTGDTLCMMFYAELTDWDKLPMSATKRSAFNSRIESYKQHAHWSIHLKRADHLVFSDFAVLNEMNVFKKLPQGSMFSIGSIDGLNAMSMVRTYLVAFFDQTIKHKQQTILQKEKQDQYHDLVIKK